ncbi:MAG: site-specific DNA-methyltransferase [Planctomycetes bacterium]|nr:site-specific DNA-methyltransferase [Planctomycetota bacterium]
MSERFKKLVTLLKELFQLDQPELDFGFYRVMHAKSAEVTKFLEEDLLPQVKKAFEGYKSADRATMLAELTKLSRSIEDAGMDPSASPKVQALQDQLANEAVDTAALESDVYDHLYRFFRRYYSDGDFLSKRVYKEGVYAIPYEGEEVKLHWANHDQYYIKTSEYLRDYAFRLRPDDDANPMRVHFRLVDAAEGEHGNVKENNKRVFVPAATDLVTEEDGPDGKELVIRFEYRPATLGDWPAEVRDGKKKPPTQSDLSAFAVEAVVEGESEGLAAWIDALSVRHVKSDGETADYSRLAAHLDRYTKRNTFDYFIHKDLGGFLRRELDFYIKNEVMHLDDIEDDTAPRVEQFLSKIKVIRRIAGKIIEFLAQLEDFQKKLWLKKKFVVETQWCVTVGCIPENFYEEIAANEAQREEWVKLFAIDEIVGDLATPAAGKKLEPSFLQGNPTLVVDTRHFHDGFTARLLEALGDVEEQADGVLFCSENSQSLSLMQARYRGQVKCIYIDPPYNTGSDGFAYKDSYQHSSWASMITERLLAARSILSADGCLFSSVDDCEAFRLRGLGDNVFGVENFVAQLVWKSRVSEDTRAKTGVSTDHEYVACYSATTDGTFRGVAKDTDKFSNPDNDLRGDWRSADLTGLANKEARPNLHYDLVDPATGAKYDCPPKGWRYEPATMKQKIAEGRVLFPASGSGRPRHKLFLGEMKSLFKNMSSVIADVSTADGTREVNDLFWNGAFAFPKPSRLVMRLVQQVASGADCVLDFFAGSGTTGHAVTNLNREDAGRRKFILVEMGDYFGAVLLPRIKKVTYAPEWKDGKPRRLATGVEAERSPRIIKVVHLESYEDALNNLEFRRSVTQQLSLDAAEAKGGNGFREQYMLRYMLDVETRGSASLLNVAAFTDPMAYTLKVKRPGSDESREVAVDLMETFNWLIGLVVRHMAAPRHYSASFRRGDDKDLPKDAPRRLLLDGKIKEETDGTWWFRAIEGELRDGRKTLVLWRNRPCGEEAEGLEQDNLVLDEWFQKQGYSSKDSEFDLIYVNGTNNLENLKAPDDTWKVRLIEEDFQRLMFDTEGGAV